MTTDTIPKIKTLTAHLITNNQTDTNTVYLYGTDDCHLCDNAKIWLNQAAAIHSKPASICYIDIMDLQRDAFDLLAQCIPVIAYRGQVLIFPFGIMDITQLLTNLNQP